MPPDDLEELRDIVRADLDHLRDTWHWGMDIHAIRRGAPLLRRLLVDNGGDIARLWKAEDRPGHPMIPNVFDLDRLPNFKGLKFGTTETPIGGGGGEAEMGWMFVWEEAAMTPDVRQAVQRDPPPRVMSLRAYLEATCVVADGKPIRRDDLICYVANRRVATTWIGAVVRATRGVSLPTTCWTASAPRGYSSTGAKQHSRSLCRSCTAL